MAALIAALAGCSAIAVRGPQTTPTGDKVCRSSYVPPIIDTVIAVAGAALIIYSATENDGGVDTDGHTLTKREAAVYPGLVLGIPFSISAMYGYSKLSGCKGPTRTAEK